MGVFQNNLMGAAAAAASAGGGDFYSYQIANSARFDGSASYLNKTWGSAPSSTTQVALSVWLKKSFTGNVNPVAIFTAIGNTGSFYFNNDDAIADNLAYYMGGGGVNGYTTNIRYRDPSAWFHFVAIINSAASNDYDRLKIYINGELIALNGGEWTFNAGYPNSNTPDAGKNGVANYIGRYGSATRYWDGYMADFIQIDGAAAISDFGETKNGVWIPKDPSGLTFGNNGFHLDFASSSDMGNDVSGNNNDWTANSISAHDQMLDSPTFNSSSNGGNFCTANSVYRGESTTDSQYGVLSEGNLTHSYSGSSDGAIPCTHKVPASGKWYFEYRIDAGGGTSNYSPAMGIMDPNEFTFTSSTIGQDGLISYDNAQNRIEKNDVIVGTYSGSRGSNGDVMGIAVDMDNGAFYVSKNGTFQTISGGSTGDPTSGASKTGAGATWTPASEYTSGMVPMSQPTGGNVPIITMNFGQNGTFNGNETAGGNSDTNGYGNFFSAVPSGYSAICSGALSVADAVDPAQTDDNYPQKLFNTILYTGDGGSSTAITGVGFQPDWVWIKRYNASENHNLYDSNRGVNKRIQSNRDVAETTEGLPAFGSDGFTVDASGGINNVSSQSYVAWNWRANGGTTSTNSTGTVNATQQVDPSGGFSISTYAGTGSSMTVGHGLSAEPKLTIVKDRDATVNWIVYTKVIDGSLDYFFLNTDAAAGDSGFTGPNSTIWNFDGSSSYSNTSGRNYIMYNFTNVEGYCKVGKYIGNGAGSDGAFVYTGFRPAWVLVKKTTQNSWRIQDNARDLYNPTYHMLKPQSNAAEDAYTDGTDYNDFLSNGFKLARGGDTVNYNANGSTYVYLAMAHNPFKYATAR